MAAGHGEETALGQLPIVGRISEGTSNFEIPLFAPEGGGKLNPACMAHSGLLWKGAV